MRDELYCELKRSVEEERLVGLVTVLGGSAKGRQRLLWPDGTSLGDLDSPVLEKWVDGRVRELFKHPGTERVKTNETGEQIDLFVETFSPRPQLVVVGAVHVAIPLIRMARVLDFRTVVIDPRSAFATAERFADADKLLRAWPEEAFEQVKLHEGSSVAVLTHDFKIDVPALVHALRSPARYVGVLGSRKTHARRVHKLREAGLENWEIERIHSPIGLDLGGRQPEQIALAILAEIVRTTFRPVRFPPPPHS